jgi:glycerol-3-phosphate acyltransferase PlsX
MKREFRKTPVRMLGAGLLVGAIKAMKKRLDPEAYGGAPLLGVNGVCIITHGGSSARAISNSIRVASESFHHNMNQLIIKRISEMNGSHD